jgi:hypothetical protein
MESLRHPQRNAAILGLLQGVPQGLTVHKFPVVAGVTFDRYDQLLIVCFGLFVPPLLMVFAHFANPKPERPWIVKVKQYVNLPAMMFWGGVSLGLVGFATMANEDASRVSWICAFFIAGGIGFLAGGVIEKRLLMRSRSAP